MLPETVLIYLQLKAKFIIISYLAKKIKYCYSYNVLRETLGSSLNSKPLCLVKPSGHGASLRVTRRLDSYSTRFYSDQLHSSVVCESVCFMRICRCRGIEAKREDWIRKGIQFASSAAAKPARRLREDGSPSAQGDFLPGTPTPTPSRPDPSHPVLLSSGSSRFACAHATPFRSSIQ